MGMEYVLSILMLIGLITFLVMMNKPKTREQIEEEPDEIEIDIEELAPIVFKIQSAIENIHRIDRMIQDIGICQPDKLLRFFHINWMSSDGKDYNVEMMADGKGATNQSLLALCNCEREYQMQLLKNYLSELSCYNQQPFEYHSICSSKNSSNNCEDYQIHVMGERIR